MPSKQKYWGLDQVPVGIGAQLKGWDFTEVDFLKPRFLRTVDFRAMTPGCPHNCYHCFTDKQRKTLTLDEIKGVIDQVAEVGARGINYLGEGEPTIDSDFFEIIEYTDEKGLIPLIFTDAATEMRDGGFVKRVHDANATVVPKCDSLFNAEYQNWVVGDKTGRYFDQRNEALRLLMDEGFNEVQEDGTTRLGFDMVVTKKNKHEVEKTLRFCRNNNLFVVFSWYLPAGRSGADDFDRSLVLTEREKQRIRETVKKIDSEYGFNHPVYNNFSTHPCVEFMQIFGDGRVSPCPGNETIIGNVREDSVRTLQQRIYEQFPGHHPGTFDGNCLYRPLIGIDGGDE